MKKCKVMWESCEILWNDGCWCWSMKVGIYTVDVFYGIYEWKKSIECERIYRVRMKMFSIGVEQDCLWNFMKCFLLCEWKCLEYFLWDFMKCYEIFFCGWMCIYMLLYDDVFLPEDVEIYRVWKKLWKMR